MARSAEGRGRRPELPPPRFFAVSSRLEQSFVQIVLAMGLVVVASQLLLTMPAVRHVLSYVDRLEGTPLGPGGASVTICLRSGEPEGSAFAILNGIRAASFATGQVRLAVGPGDLLEVDGTALDGEGVFEIVSCQGGVSGPAVGEKTVTRKGVASFGRVTFESDRSGD